MRDEVFTPFAGLFPIQSRTNLKKKLKESLKLGWRETLFAIHFLPVGGRSVCRCELATADIR